MSLSNKLSITDVDLKGKRVLIRVSPAQFAHRNRLENRIGTDDQDRSTSMSPLTPTRRSPITSESRGPSQRSNMPLIMALRL